jgi:hypothetical protein
MTKNLDKWTDPVFQWPYNSITQLNSHYYSHYNKFELQITADSNYKLHLILHKGSVIYEDKQNHTSLKITTTHHNLAMSYEEKLNSALLESFRLKINCVKKLKSQYWKQYLACNGCYCKPLSLVVDNRQVKLFTWQPWCFFLVASAKSQAVMVLWNKRRRIGES